MAEGERRYSIGELADLGGVSRRTVRYYVHNGLLPAPRGRGRGDHYGEEHLEALLRIRAMQEAGWSLAAIAAALRGGAAPAPPQPERTVDLWARIPVVPGLELHVAVGAGRPTLEQIDELARAAREILDRPCTGDESEEQR